MESMNCSILPAQTFALKNIGIADGLPSQDVFESFQDSDCYLWFATESGAVRYNGYDFFQSQFGNHLDHSDILGFMEDSYGRIWFRTLGGDVCYFQNGEYHSSDNDSLCKELSFTCTVLKIFEVGDLLFFISSGNGVHILDGDLILRIPTPPIKNACKISNGVFLIGHSGSLKMDLNGNISPIDSIPRNTHYAAAIHHRRRTFISYGSILTQYLEGQTTLDTVFQTNSGQEEIINLVERDDSTIFICTRQGVSIFNTFTLQVIRSELFGHPVTSVFQDQEHGLWFTTLEKGIYYDPEPGSRPRRMFKEVIPDRVSTIFTDPKGNLWLGSENNKVIYLNAGVPEIFDLRIDAKTRLDHITEIKTGPSGEIVVIGKMVFSIIRDGTIIETVLGSGNDLHFDNEGNLWVAGVNCYQIFNFGKGMKFRGRRPATLRKRTYCLAPYKDQFLAGTESGLYMYHGSDSGFVLIAGTEEYSITDIHLPYILTKAGGVLQLSREKASPIRIEPALRTKCYALHAINDHLFIGTNKGLFRADRNSRSWSVRSIMEGTNVYDIENIGDSLFIGSEKGVLVMNIRDVADQPSIPTLRLDSILVNGNLNSQLGIQNLSHQENSVKICFTGLLYSHHPTYRYRINNEAWSDLKTRELNLKLSPGSYKVEIEAINGTSARSAPLLFQIHIAEPFWRRTWFLMGLTFFLLSVFAIGFWNYLRKIKKEHQRQRELDQANLNVANIRTRILELEQQALRLQMNPHFLFNSINSIKGLYAQGKVKEAITYIHHFSTFLRVIVNNESPLISIRTEVDILYHYLNLEKMKFPLIEFKIELGAGIDPDRMQIPFMLIQPFVENAIIHGIGPKKEKGTIMVQILKAGNDMVEINITDDGIGLSNRKNTPKKTSMGIKITEERLSMFNNSRNTEIKIVNRPDKKGVIVTFQTRYVYE